MTLQNFVSKLNYALRGTDDTAPALGDDDWIYWTSVANRKKDEMYDDTKQNWASAFQIKSIGTISISAAPSFNLGSDFLYVADQAFVTDLAAQNHYYDVIKPQEIDLTKTCQEVYIAGANPQVLHLTNAVATGDTTIGGTLYLPSYWRPADIDVTSISSVIPVDDPNWLVMATAAQIAFNDIIYEEKFDDLNGQANVLYNAMAHKNRRGAYGRPRVSKTYVKRIPGFRR